MPVDESLGKGTSARRPRRLPHAMTVNIPRGWRINALAGAGWGIWLARAASPICADPDCFLSGAAQIAPADRCVRRSCVADRRRGEEPLWVLIQRISRVTGARRETRARLRPRGSRSITRPRNEWARSVTRRQPTCRSPCWSTRPWSRKAMSCARRQGAVASGLMRSRS